MVKCRDCGVNNKSFQEYCVHCGSKLTKSHRILHSNIVRTNFVLDAVRSR